LKKKDYDGNEQAGVTAMLYTFIQKVPDLNLSQDAIITEIFRGFPQPC
jgi:hypothetical protein